MHPLSRGSTRSKRQRNGGRYLKCAGCSRLRRLVCQARLCRLPRAGEGIIFQGPLPCCIADIALLSFAPKLRSQGCRGCCIQQLSWVCTRLAHDADDMGNEGLPAKPTDALGVPPVRLSPPATIEGVEMGRYLKRAACMAAQTR